MDIPGFSKENEQTYRDHTTSCVLWQVPGSRTARASFLEANVSQSGSSADFYFEISWSKCMPFGQKMPRWTLTCSPWVRRPGGIVWRAVCSSSWQESGDGMGCPPQAGHWDAADFSADFLRIFAWLWNTYFWNAQTSKKNMQNICAKICDGRKKLRTKNLRKNGRKNLHRKSAHQKSAQKPVWTFRFSGRWKPEKNNTKKSAPKLCQTPAPSFLCDTPLVRPVFGLR